VFLCVNYWNFEEKLREMGHWSRYNSRTLFIDNPGAEKETVGFFETSAYFRTDYMLAVRNILIALQELSISTKMGRVFAVSIFAIQIWKYFPLPRKRCC